LAFEEIANVPESQAEFGREFDQRWKEGYLSEAAGMSDKEGMNGSFEVVAVCFRDNSGEKDEWVVIMSQLGRTNQ